jgi:hypothetical protein
MEYDSNSHQRNTLGTTIKTMKDQDQAMMDEDTTIREKWLAIGSCKKTFVTQCNFLQK